MGNLQKVNLGAIPDGAGGDDARTAFNRGNTNVDVLNSQAALTSAQPVTAAQALTAAHVGKRVNISLASDGVVNMPTASTCAADSVILLRNIGTTVATLAGTTESGDDISLSKLNPGETALMDTDGVHAWTVLMRGRTNSDNEVVNGNFTVSGNSTVNNSTVNGNETVGGTLGVTGAATLASATVSGQLAAKGNTYFGLAAQASISAAGAYSGPSANYRGNVGVGGTLGVTGLATLAGGVVANSLLGNAATVVGSSASTLALYSNNTQRAMLDVNGSLHVNEAAAWAAAQLSVRNSATNTWGISAYCSAQVGGCFNGRTDSPSVPLAAWFFGTANVGTITTNGSSTAYGTGSDYRLKDGIEDLDGDFAVTLIRQGRPRKFWMRADPEKRINYGFIAHEYAEIQPEAVVGEKDGMGPPMVPPVDGEGNTADMPHEPRYQHMDYSKPTPILWAALDWAIGRIERLENDLRAMKEKQ